MGRATRTATILVGLVLCACANSSGAMKIGPDTYLISVYAAPARGGSAGAKRIALGEALLFCNQKGLEMLVDSISTGNRAGVWRNAGSADVQFLCLKKGDPGLVRPTLRQAPDTVIEVR